MAKILIIDDEPQLRQMLMEVLTHAGHQTYQAADGEIGMDLALDLDPDLIVCDLVMPNREGIETIRIIAKDLPETKILAVSGGGRQGSMTYLEMAEKLGAHDSLVKPFQLDKFLAKVELLLG